MVFPHSCGTSLQHVRATQRAKEYWVNEWFNQQVVEGEAKLACNDHLDSSWATTWQNLVTMVWMAYHRYDIDLTLRSWVICMSQDAMCFRAWNNSCTCYQKVIPLLLPTKSADTTNHASHNNSSPWSSTPQSFLLWKINMAFENKLNYIWPNTCRT